MNGRTSAGATVLNRWGPHAPSGLDVLQAAVMFMAFVAVWRVQDLFPVLAALKLQFVAPALGLLAFLADSDPRRAARRILNPLAYKLYGIAVMIALSIPTSLWAGKSLNFFLNDHAKTLLLMTLMAASIRSSADVIRYAGMHVAGAVMYSYFIITNFRVSARSGRLGDLIYYDSNDLGLLLVATIPLCVFFLRPQARVHVRVAASAVLALLVYTLVQTGSRGAFLALIGCGAYLLFNFAAIQKTVRVYAVGALVAFLFVFGGDRYWEMMSSLLTPKQDYNWTSESGRKELWKRGIGYMLTHPFTGVGARAYQQAEGTISNISVRQQYGIGLKWSTAHNSFVELGAELGLIGLGLFVAGLLHAWKYVRGVGSPGLEARAGPLGPLGHALGGTLIAYCIAGFFVSAAYSAFLYTIFGMVLGMMKLIPAAKDGTVLVPAAGSQPSLGSPVVPPAAGPIPSHVLPARRRSALRYPGPAPVPRQPAAGAS